MPMAMKLVEQSRISDLCDEPVDRLLTPIRGYEIQPLVSLIDAIKPISGSFNRIEDYQNPSDDLTQQESASIHLYTMQFSGGPSFYLLLNQSLYVQKIEKNFNCGFLISNYFSLLYTNYHHTLESFLS